MSTLRFSGIIMFCASLHAQISALPFHASADPYSGPVLTASGDGPILGDFPSPRSDAKPISGLISLRELQHPIPKKALRAAYDAQKLARAKRIPQAIVKFEEAIGIDPAYRDAHIDLGVAYAQIGRTADARTQFQEALDIGPPAAPIYVDLALTSLALGNGKEAEIFARKALEWDPENGSAKRALRLALTH